MAGKTKQNEPTKAESHEHAKRAYNQWTSSTSWEREAKEYWQVLKNRYSLETLEPATVNALDRSFSALEKQPNEINKVAVWQELNRVWLGNADHLSEADKKRLEIDASMVRTMSGAERVWKSELVHHIVVLGQPFHDSLTGDLQTHYGHCVDHILDLYKRGDYNSDNYAWWFAHKVVYQSYLEQQTAREEDERRAKMEPVPPPPMAFGEEQKSETESDATKPKPPPLPKSAKHNSEELIATGGSLKECRKLAEETTNPKILEILSENDNKKVRIAVARNRHKNSNTVALLAIDSSTSVRVAIAEQIDPGTISGPGPGNSGGVAVWQDEMTYNACKKLAEDRSRKVRSIIAKRTQSWDMLHKLASDSTYSVRDAVAENKQTSSGLLNMMVDKILPNDARDRLKGRLANMNPYISGMKDRILIRIIRNPNTALLTLETIAERGMSGHSVAANMARKELERRGVTRKPAAATEEDPYIDTGFPAAEGQQAGSDRAIAKEIEVAKNGDVEERVALARRTESPQVLDALADSPEPEVVMVVVSRKELGKDTALKIARGVYGGADQTSEVHARLASESKDEDVLGELSYDPFDTVRRVVGRNASSAQTLRKLASADDVATRANVAGNKNATADAIDVIIQREIDDAANPDIRNYHPALVSYAIENRNISNATLEKIAAATVFGNIDITGRAQRKLAARAATT